MNYTARSITGSVLFQSPAACDSRGRFTMTWDQGVFRKAGTQFTPTSACHSYNPARATLRGLHYQRDPHQQAKVVTCVQGAVYDVVVDLRKQSETYLSWEAIELREDDGASLYIPAGCAHGFLTLAPHSTISYLLDGVFRPESGMVLRWNDPAIAIDWPTSAAILSDRDRLAADYVP
jgi:dTDP-4-dehydrorhamnose 3,5-epimerase